MPTVAAFIGLNIIAGLLVTDFQQGGWSVLIYLFGTNGGLIGNRHNLHLACSTAAGPAFEGASISFGVAGVPGQFPVQYWQGWWD